MKINPIIQQNIIQSYRSTATSKTEKAKAPVGRDEVSFSEEGLSFSKVMADVKAQVSSGVNESASSSRIDEIKAQIQDGTYFVDSSIIAGKMIDSIVGE